MWHLRRPSLFWAEKKEWESHGFSLDREIFSSQRVVVFSGEIEFEEEKYEFNIEYPPGYPHIYPRVVSKSTTHRRHQMPVHGELCLLEGWKDYGWIGCEQIFPRIKLWLQGQKHGFNPVLESEAPEPMFYHALTTTQAVVLTPTDIYETWEEKDGIMQVQLRNQNGVLQGELAVISSEKEEKQRISSQMYLPEMSDFVGYCVNVDETPPYFKTDQELIEWLEGKGHEKVRRRCEILKEKSYDKSTPFALGPLLGIRYIEDEKPRFLLVALSECRKVDNWNEQVLQMVVFESEDVSEERLFKRVSALRPLKEKHALVLGVGAIGSQIAIDLAKAGIGKLTLVDHECLSVGNVVRHVGTMEDVGLFKVDIVAKQAQAHNPYANIFRVGRYWGNTKEEYIRDALKGVDLIVCAVGHSPTERYTDEIARLMDIPVVYTYASGGAWSGRAFRVIPDATGCYHCHQYRIEDGSIPSLRQPLESGAIYEAGCVGPAFPGSGVDTGIIANMATRLAIQTLLRTDPTAYELSPYDHIVWYTQGNEGQLEHKQVVVPPYEGCLHCELSDEPYKEGVTPEGKALLDAMVKWEELSMEYKLIPVGEVLTYIEEQKTHPDVEASLQAEKELKTVVNEYKGRIYENETGRFVFRRLRLNEEDPIKQWEVWCVRVGEDTEFSVLFDEFFGYKEQDDVLLPRFSRVTEKEEEKVI